VMLGAAEIVNSLNGSHSTSMSSLFVKWHANMNSFSPALFQLSSPASFWSSRRFDHALSVRASWCASFIICLVPSSNWWLLSKFPHVESKMVNNGSFTRRPPFSLGKDRRQAAVLRPIFQAFLYAQSHIDVRIFKSASGHQMRGAEKENSDGRHIDTTFSAWSILRSSFLRR